MSDAIAFDTYRFVKRLTTHGFTEEQAEVLASEQVDLLNSNLSTKADIDALRQSTKADIAGVRRDIEALRLSTKVDIAEAKTSLLKWTYGAMIVQGGLIVGLVKLL